MREQQRAHGKGERGVQDPAKRAEAPAPGRIKDLLIRIAAAQPKLPEQEIQVMVAVLMDQVVHQIEVVTLEAVDEGQAGAVAVAVAHDARRAEGVVSVNCVSRVVASVALTASVASRVPSWIFSVIPAKAGIQVFAVNERWMPASAGMTKKARRDSEHRPGQR